MMATVMTVLQPLLIRLGVSKWASPIIQLMAPIIGITQPFIGSKSDKCKSKWGKRKPFLLFGFICALLCFAFFIMIDENVFGDGNAAIAMAIVGFFMCTLSMNFMMGPGRTIVFDLAGDGQQFAGNLMMMVLTGVSTLAGLGFMAFTKRPFIFSAVFCSLLCLPTFLFVKEPPLAKETTASKGSESAHKKKDGTFKEMKKGLCLIIKNRQMLMIIIFSFFELMSLMCFSSFFSLFMTSAIYRSNDPGLTPEESKIRYDKGIQMTSFSKMASNLMMTLFSAIAAPIIMLLGMRLSFIVTCVCSTAAVFALVFVSPMDTSLVWLAFLANILSSVNLAMIMSVPPVVIAAECPQDQLGMYMGLFALFAMGGQMLASLIPVGINSNIGLYSGGRHYLQWDFLFSAICGVCGIIVIPFLKEVNIRSKNRKLPGKEKQGKKDVSSKEQEAGKGDESESSSGEEVTPLLADGGYQRLGGDSSAGASLVDSPTMKNLINTASATSASAMTAASSATLSPIPMGATPTYSSFETTGQTPSHPVRNDYYEVSPKLTPYSSSANQGNPPYALASSEAGYRMPSGGINDEGFLSQPLLNSLDTN
ncbi:putative Glycoside-Pentoside-Hexuronide(GPH):CationSymporterFamilyProtein [Monocercomonoides exilis]|uniref:putative Glycoside-Pentoside- Hexuronide(GPH):CationSymporterFamilyProtein n=1 Tax=Monocercomonoides exilis TaxID=2049356 RepID=UPI0035598F08|nr:putative Glycoside-Pentoside-Hexuronide(GPH):CationSymporterFamilyProtein [Monocercomonoides exilis]|eukprot:MONOS_8601.1-p1 / transcript=MONOS_8601.1 / gene=MONOS_8601 / organism=Monocercomonoides_exilis_PA203 / gene_product=Glycoside-Pentoside-Hexuronide(GPH):CationSymporterFamilyProtein / transcript_product=Glycoside-Pentoside-Hexuronide(GPH):CationSymporterFamilyProtein / location=Mono_scaffold00328:19418-21329(-) / protein_length=592 / sequence_SO=supercontig / SO=protein_coding / is_pseudo=false